MFWMLYLAHLMGDYPLQTDWMARAKRTWWGLLLHVSVHLAVMLLLVGELQTLVWPYLLLLTLIHVTIDSLKNVLLKRRPQWVMWPYIIDQLLHLASVWVIATWIMQVLPPEQRPETASWMIYLTGYLLVTQVWYITERLATYQNKRYQQEVIAESWSRMVSRAILLSLFVAASHLINPMLPLAALGIHLPYMTGCYRRRAFLTDLAVALITMIFLQLAI